MSDLALDRAQDAERRTDPRLVRWLFEWVRPYRWRVVGAVLLVLGGSGLQIVGPLLTATAVDLYLKPNPGPSATRILHLLERAGLPTIGGAGLMTLTAFYLASLMLGAVLASFQARTMLLTGQFVMRDLRDALFRHLQRLELAWFNRTPAGRVITRLTNDVEALNEIFTSGLVDILSDFMLLAGIVTVLFSLDWRLALVSFSVLPFMVLLSLWFRSRARHIYREVRMRLAALNTHLQEHLAGMSIVQLSRAEDRTYEKFRQLDADHRDVNVRGVFYYAVFYPTVELLTSLGLAMLLLLGGFWSDQGTVTLGVLIAFLQYLQRFFRPISDLAENFNVLQAALAAAERLHGLLQTEPAIMSPRAPVQPLHRGRSIEFEQVSFAYEPGQWALRDVSFRVAPDERVAVVGHTGAGKSTLVNLILRFYEPQEGRVLIDGVDTRLWKLAELRGRFAIVLQDVDCFAGTLRDNVSLGRKGIGDERIRWALEQVQAGALLDRLQRGLDSLLGERGIGLSTGERQLVSFARALVADPEFLILDEATASVDPITEAAIQKALERLLQARTAVIIAHRLATVIGCDRALVFHAGRLIEEGTHQELLIRGGVYRTLYELQLLQSA